MGIQSSAYMQQGRSTPSLCWALSLRYNGHFPGGPRLAGTRMSPFWILLILMMMEVVVTTGVIRCAVKSSPPTNQHPVFTGRMPFLSPNRVRTLKGTWGTTVRSLLAHRSKFGRTAFLPPPMTYMGLGTRSTRTRLTGHRSTTLTCAPLTLTMYALFVIHAEHVVHSAWILFWLWMFVCMFVCMLGL